MMIKYVSEGGTVEFGGGLNDFGNITKMNGFGLPSKQYDEVEFAGENGVVTTGSKDLARTLTISGDFYGGQYEITKLLKSFYYPGKLYCGFENVKRKIACKCINLDDIERNNNCGINGFTVQFKADFPYFTDFYSTRQSLASYKNLVTDEFTLPCVFTEMIQQGSCFNNGDLITYPVIKITAENKPGLPDDPVITITNKTTGAFIKLNQKVNTDDAITIDLGARKIKSRALGNITHKISDDTVLSSFCLNPGKNDITFQTTDTSQRLTASIEYDNLYLTAVR